MTRATTNALVALTLAGIIAVGGCRRERRQEEATAPKEASVDAAAASGEAKADALFFQAGEVPEGIGLVDDELAMRVLGMTANPGAMTNTRFLDEHNAVDATGALYGRGDGSFVLALARVTPKSFKVSQAAWEVPDTEHIVMPVAVLEGGNERITILAIYWNTLGGKVAPPWVAKAVAAYGTRRSLDRTAWFAGVDWPPTTQQVGASLDGPEPDAEGLLPTALTPGEIPMGFGVIEPDTIPGDLGMASNPGEIGNANFRGLVNAERATATVYGAPDGSLAVAVVSCRLRTTSVSLAHFGDREGLTIHIPAVLQDDDGRAVYLVLLCTGTGDSLLALELERLGVMADRLSARLGLRRLFNNAPATRSPTSE